MTGVTWVLEAETFPGSHESMREAIVQEQNAVVIWNADWWANGRWPRLNENAVVFHGSLGNAARITQELPWRPGAYCNTAAFHCSSWYPRAKEWLVHRDWKVISVNALVTNPNAALDCLGGPDAIFIRPDSPLKPFSGRVLHRDAISLKALDHGFYFDDINLPVVLAPVRSITREWRYVVVSQEVVAGSAYQADGRSALPDDSTGGSWQFASLIAKRLEAPEEVYVMDICEANDELRLLELNPFSGADLYACRRRDVVAAVSKVVLNRVRK